MLVRKFKGIVTREDEDRIIAEYSRCICRQMLYLRDGVFKKPEWRHFEEELMISHTGHLMDPDRCIVTWHNGQKPQPNFQGTMNGLRASGRTYDAVGRPRFDREQFDEPKPSITETIWPPADLKMPRELKMFRYHLQIEDSQCWLCMGHNHKAKQCPFWFGFVIHHPDGRKLIGNTVVPKEIAEAYLPHALMMNVCLYYNMPLKMATELAQLVLSDEAPYDRIEELNDSLQRDKMAKYLKYEPGSYSQMPWDKLHQKYLDECKKGSCRTQSVQEVPTTSIWRQCPHQGSLQHGI
jgi:hypothetical protein